MTITNLKIIPYCTQKHHAITNTNKKEKVATEETEKKTEVSNAKIIGGLAAIITGVSIYSFSKQLNAHVCKDILKRIYNKIIK